MHKKATCIFPQWLRRGCSVLLVAWLWAGAMGGAVAQTGFPRNVPFTDPSTNNTTGFVFGGNALLTGTAANGSTAAVPGYLRLTAATGNQAGYAIDKNTFQSTNGFRISFEFFSFNTSSATGGADGFTVFLVDADKADPSANTFRVGAYGGSLGYAQKTAAGGATGLSADIPGVSYGYIGIGFDEYGNYSNGYEGRSGGLYTTDTRTANAVSIRGAGNTTATTDYPYLTSTGNLNTGTNAFTLTSGTMSEAQAGTAGYRKAYIDVVPKNGSYLITVRVQVNSTVNSVITSYQVLSPPTNLRIGFAGSTGGSVNIHEIRNLALVQPPIANNDNGTTAYNKAITLNVLSNDLAPGSSINASSVDLDPSTAAIDNSLTVAGKGTFAADANGLVTFTPIGTFSGIVTIPYTIQSLLGDTSLPATITIIVTGADVATSISGPTTANPGARVTYTVGTSNIGVENALNVVPTLQLPAGATSIALPSGATTTTNSSGTLVTFATIASVVNGADPVNNSVTFTMPASGSVAATANATSASADPNTANNTATITTAVTGIASIGTGCAAPGQDGPGPPAGVTVPNTYFPGTATVAAGATSLTLDVATGYNTPIVAGDLLIIMQMQGADINTANSTAYGANSSTGAGNLSTNYTAGTYEYAIAASGTSVTYASGGTLNLVGGLANAYTNAGATTAAGARRYQVIRVPQYASLAVSGTITGVGWNGTSGGVLALDVAGATAFASGGTLDMSGYGFRGGGGRRHSGSTTYAATDFVNTAATTTAGAHGTKGEGFAGTPRYVTASNATTVTNTMADSYPGGGAGQGAPGNAGGGGTDALANTTNAGNTGGGGGGNGAAGGNGGSYNATATGGRAGVAAASASASRLFLGGGGGAGSSAAASNAIAFASSGAPGGGIILLRTGSISGTGSVLANGSAAATVAGAGGGGGGAGGTILLSAKTVAGLGNLTVRADGGAGAASSSSTADYYGSGGGGGGGVVYANGTLAASSAAAGAAGASTSTAGTSANGGAVGTAGPVNTSATIPTGIAGAGSCLPALTAALSTSTPNITRNSSGVNPATYNLVVSNTGGAARLMSVAMTLDNSGTSGAASGLFTYSSTKAVQLTAADGTVTTLDAASYTAPTANTSTPTYSGLAIPAGATLTISYVANVAAAAVTGTAYQASATITFLDPTRTTAAQTATPQGTFAGGGTVPGSNYVATTSVAEDVTIVRPLPVELKEFTATAIRQDVLLTWATATERNNDRFEIERSTTGQDFEKVGTVRGQGTSSKLVNYQFTDLSANRLGATTIYYRLRQFDLDGQATYSPVQAVRFAALKASAWLYPNPAPAQATLDLSALGAGTYQVQVLDLTGRVLRQQALPGGQAHVLEVQALPPGTYLVLVQSTGLRQALPLIRN